MSVNKQADRHAAILNNSMHTCLSRSILERTNTLHALLLYRRSGYLHSKSKSICAKRPSTPKRLAGVLTSQAHIKK
ncbi:hypothetical protein N018_11845 [Pseudomonas syringae CC1557]|uniref:Uncharacterized protein n=1 Tax=Pseudomonas syringae CC1557 TaxID=1357279 RepID=W0N263_PSESX|nr:hypothetical protein N018_11845 [Pseudomonas syringae CC1557]